MPIDVTVNVALWTASVSLAVVAFFSTGGIAYLVYKAQRRDAEFDALRKIVQKQEEQLRKQTSQIFDLYDKIDSTS